LLKTEQKKEKIEIEQQPLNKIEKIEYKILSEMMESGKLLSILEQAKNLHKK
jgi:hypothetical protein